MSFELIPAEIPVLPVYRSVLFPGHYVRFKVRSTKGIDLCRHLARVAKRSKDFPYVGMAPVLEDTRLTPNIIHPIGTVAKVEEIRKSGSKGFVLVVRGMVRFRADRYTQESPFFKAAITELPDDVDPNDSELEKKIQEFRSLLSQYVSSIKLDSTLAGNLSNIVRTAPAGLLCDALASMWKASIDDRVALLDCVQVSDRIDLTTRLLTERMEGLRSGNNGKSGTSSPGTQGGFPQPQNAAGQSDNGLSELKTKLEEADIPEPSRETVMKEFGRLSRLRPSAVEYDILRTYLEWVAALPWSVSTEDSLDIVSAQKQLDDDHTGLDKVKKRIIEYLSVRQLRQDMKGPIMCLVGPPGVGKTSLGKSVAASLGRKFIRIALGGVHDESVIRGHRRTYVGALPGRILDGIKKAGTNNPVMLLDEVDKLGQSVRGDPAAALLEVLDPEQNHAFSDHYLNCPFDLSKVLFIATANELDRIPAPLQDRMEVIQLPGYTYYEKVDIAMTHLLPKQLKEHGLATNAFSISKEAMMRIAREYTRESGVRSMERKLAAVCRYFATQAVKRLQTTGSKEAGPSKSSDNSPGDTPSPAATATPDGPEVQPEDLARILGPAVFPEDDPQLRTDIPGVGLGMVWTRVGGELLRVEASRMPGKGKLTLTGKLGDVLKESATAALSWIRSNGFRYGLAPSRSTVLLDTTDIHIHFPAAAIGKDGPSAGITILLTLLSLLSGKVMRSDTAMTGEISLRGLVLPVGGVKEKVLAAHRAGIRRVLLPHANAKDLEDIPAAIRKQIAFFPMKTVEEAIPLAFAEGETWEFEPVTPVRSRM